MTSSAKQSSFRLSFRRRRLDRRKGRYQGTQYFRSYKSARRVIMPDWRGTPDLRREYAFVYRAGLLNKTGFPVGVRFPRYKLYDFAHLPTKAGLGGVIPPMTAGVRISCQGHPTTSHDSLWVASWNSSSGSRSGDPLACADGAGITALVTSSHVSAAPADPSHWRHRAIARANSLENETSGRHRRCGVRSDTCRGSRRRACSVR